MNQSLVDDGLVDKEKIGGTNYFWSFPAKKDRQQQIQHEATLQAIEQIKTNLPSIETALKDAKRGREEEEEVLVAAEEENAGPVDDAAATNETDKTEETAVPPPPTKKIKSTGRAAISKRNSSW